MERKGKIIVLSAPSGTGKSTIIQRLMEMPELHLGFSISATWEEVYPGCRYGTLLSEVERVTGSGRNLIMDIDVKGALSIKRVFGAEALCIFIEPPSLQELERRLRDRATDTDEVIARRLAKAEYELSFAPRFDAVVGNDSLDQAVSQARQLIITFSK